jgi:NAD(P)-dependent dehydrogenase (short-subunit alcohol dehydrogenase family)
MRVMRAIVTGASSGIGLAVAKRLVGDGATVMLVSRREPELERIATTLGKGALAFAADVSDPAQVRSMVEDADRRLGGVDLAVNSAGISQPAALDELSPERWREVIDVNLSGCFFVDREAGLLMRAQGGGSIVNVASESALMGESAYVAYCASKGGVLALTKAMAAELAPTVRVNAVCPGSVDTPMLRRDFDSMPDPSFARESTRRRIALRRFASPDEVAAAVIYVGTEAGFATGMGLNLDGGTTSTLPAML